MSISLTWVKVESISTCGYYLIVILRFFVISSIELSCSQDPDDGEGKACSISKNPLHEVLLEVVVPNSNRDVDRSHDETDQNEESSCHV